MCRLQGPSYVAIQAQFNCRFHHSGPTDKTICTLVNKFNIQWKDWSHQDIHWKESKIIAASVTMSLCLIARSWIYISLVGGLDAQATWCGSTFPWLHADGHFVCGFIKRCVFTQHIPTSQELRNHNRQAAAAITPGMLRYVFRASSKKWEVCCDVGVDMLKVCVCSNANPLQLLSTSGSMQGG